MACRTVLDDAHAFVTVDAHVAQAMIALLRGRAFCWGGGALAVQQIGASLLEPFEHASCDL